MHGSMDKGVHGGTPVHTPVHTTVHTPADRAQTYYVHYTIPPYYYVYYAHKEIGNETATNSPE